MLVREMGVYLLTITSFLPSSPLVSAVGESAAELWGMKLFTDMHREMCFEDPQFLVSASTDHGGEISSRRIRRAVRGGGGDGDEGGWR